MLGSVFRRKLLLSIKKRKLQRRFAKLHLRKPQVFWTDGTKAEMFGHDANILAQTKHSI